MTETNPAARLLEVLSSRRRCADTNRPAQETWGLALGVTVVESVEFTVARAEVSTLVADLHHEIIALRGIVDTDRRERNLARWARFINLPGKGAGQGLSRGDIASDDELDLLSSLSDTLNARAPEVAPSPEAVEGLLARVRELIDDVLNAEDLDAELRWALLRHLRFVEDALANVRIRGQRGLDEVLGRMSLDAGRNLTRWERIAQSSVWSKLKQLIGALNLVSGATNDAAQITENARKLLELGPPPGS